MINRDKKKGRIKARSIVKMISSKPEKAGNIITNTLLLPIRWLLLNAEEFGDATERWNPRM